MQSMDWLDLNLHAAALSTNACMESIRRYSFGVQFDLAGPPLHTFKDLGYTQAKARNMSRIYLNEQSVSDAAKYALKRKDHAITSLAFTFVGSEKRKDSQGHCMQTGVFSFGRKHAPTLTLFYRSTEVTKKFGADLVFLRDVVIPKLSIEEFIRKDQKFTVRFNFAMCYFSLHFIPVLYAYGGNAPTIFLDEIEKTNREYWLQAIRRLPWFFDDRFISKMSMIRNIHEYTVSRPQLKSQLEKYYHAHVQELPRGVERDPPRP